jgi:hypothetical protein
MLPVFIKMFSSLISVGNPGSRVLPLAHRAQGLPPWGLQNRDLPGPRGHLPGPDQIVSCPGAVTKY